MSWVGAPRKREPAARLRSEHYSASRRDRWAAIPEADREAYMGRLAASTKRAIESGQMST